MFRQIPPWGAKWSVGQLMLVPVQVSATSQAPAAARQIAPEFPATCRQTPKVVSQESTVQAFPSSTTAGGFVTHAAEELHV